MEKHSLVFPFGEVNSAVFQNAAIFALKKIRPTKVTVFSPKEFFACYFHVDSLIEIAPLPYESYSEVSNYRFPIFSKKRPTTWFNPQILNYFFQRFQQSLPSWVFHSLPQIYKADYKGRKYLYKSGIYRWVKNDARRLDTVFLGTASYMDISTMELYKCDIREAMYRNFRDLSRMISEGAVQTQEQIERIQEIKSFSYQDLDKSEYELVRKMEGFIKANSKVAYIRTRNIKGQADVHNTDSERLLLLTNSLLALGWAVLNTGTPTIELPITDSKYLEVSHNLSIGHQFYLASKCNARVMSAEAGLFVAWAATELPLILIGEEWSVTNLDPPISLIKARQSIGIQDQRLRTDFTTSEIAKIFS
jgi:hypothetical protein